MDLDPKKLFIGVIDLFAVLLPGALLAYVLREHPAVAPSWGAVAPGEKALVFIFAAYVLGHAAFLLGARFLDEYVYDWVRKGTDGAQVERLAKGGALAHPFARALATMVFDLKGYVDLAVRRAVRIKEHHLDPLAASSAINAFQWCKVRLALEKPDALATLERLEADSKFFRSFAVVLFVLALWLPQDGAARTLAELAVVKGLILLGAALALWRYVDQRAKAVTQAYWFVIGLESGRAGGFRDATADWDTGPGRAGGVVMRVRGGVEVLLVRASTPSAEWILPKGKIEQGECAPETAVRGVRQKSGVWARIAANGELGTLTYVRHRERVEVRVFAMEALELDGLGGAEGRDVCWCSLDDARALVRPETREFLERVRHQVARHGGAPAPAAAPAPAPAPQV